MLEIGFLPADLGRWDQAAGADLFAAAVFRDVRPLRGATGLVDWRLCGQISQLLREARICGSSGEKLLVATRRLPWRAVLVLGLGEAHEFDEERCQEALVATFDAMRGLGHRSVALPVPGRELGRITPERALALVWAAAAGQEHLQAITVVDTQPALKAMTQAGRASTTSTIRLGP